MNHTSQIQFMDSDSGNRKSKIQNPKWAGFLAIVFTLTMCGVVAEAQQQAKIAKIGVALAVPFRLCYSSLGSSYSGKISVNWAMSRART